MTEEEIHGNIVWHPYPDTRPSIQQQYLAGHTKAIPLYWSNGAWKTKPGDESDLTNRVRWWAEMPLPPNATDLDFGGKEND